MTKIIEYDVVVVGAGQCGLLLAYYLAKENISYIVLEKERPFSVWYKRWDNFNMNTANWMNSLPGLSASDTNKSSSRKEIIRYFEQWLNSFSANIQISTVKNIKLDNKKYIIESEENTYKAKAVVFAVGLNKNAIPKLNNNIPTDVPKFHSSEYRYSDQIKTKNILVVGTGSSGVQICEDLAKTNKYSISLSCSRNKYFKWKYFGVSIYSYVKYLKLFTIKSHSFFGRFVISQTRNKGDPATPPGPELLQLRYGVDLKGRLVAIENNNAIFENNQKINLKNTTVIWCTGYQVDISSLVDGELQTELLNAKGYPKLQSDFQSEVSKIFFIGLRFQRLVSSHILYGAIRDAKCLVSEIRSELKNS